jgi:superoxide reductase
MADKLSIYKCFTCGNMVELVHSGGGTLTCCNAEMVLMNENSTDAATEKHVPVIEKTPDGFKVKVGSVAHPMADDHYIEWIQIIDGQESSRVFLKPGDAPEAEFKSNAASIKAREYCNKHGLWKAEY